MSKRDPLSHRQPDSAWHQKLRELAEKGNVPMGVPPPPGYEKADPQFSKLTNIDPSAQSAANAKTKRDRQLSEENYKEVFFAFKDTGNPQELAERTGLQPIDIDHLLNYGIARLGLPPIRERAVNRDLVDAGLQAALNELGLQQADPTKALTYRQTKAAAQGATDRATRETAAAQVLLESGLTAAKVLQAYTERLQEMVDADMIEVPQAITPDTIAKLSRSFNDFARGMSAIVQISQNTAQDTSQNNSLAFAAAHLIDKMNPDEMAIFIKKKHIPRHLRAGGGQEMDAPREVIDIKEEKVNEEEKLHSDRTHVSPEPEGASSEVASDSEEVKR